MSAEFEYFSPEEIVDLTEPVRETDPEWKGIIDNLQEGSESGEQDPAEWKRIMENLQEPGMEGEKEHGSEGNRDSGVRISKEKMEDGTLRETIRSPFLEKMIQEHKMEQDRIHDTGEAAKEWHLQKYNDTCAIVSQQFILNEYTKVIETEEEMRFAAMNHGWYVPGEGTSGEDIGNLLELYGVHTTTKWAASFDDILQASRKGERMIVTVNDLALSTEYSDYYPLCSSNHAIEIVTVDEAKQKVIVNDPGVEDGRMKEISYDNFMDAWFTGLNYLLIAHRE